MAGYGQKDANRALRERKDSKPRATYCGDCGEECDTLLCDDCRQPTLVLVGDNPRNQVDYFNSIY